MDWRQECREQSIAEVLQSEDALLINDSDGEIADKVTNVTASETFDIMDAVKCFTEIYSGHLLIAYIFFRNRSGPL